MTPITGKIAAIVTAQSIVINRGRKDSVQVGMRFSIRLVVPNIVDPDEPGRVLGSLGFEKGRAVVQSVHEGMSYCALEPLPVPTVPAAGSKTSADFASELLRQFTVQPSYPKVDGKKLLEGAEWSVRVGDEVIQLAGSPSFAPRRALPLGSGQGGKAEPPKGAAAESESRVSETTGGETEKA